MNDHTRPASDHGGGADLLLQRYAEANALDEARPGPGLREAVLAHARAQAAAHAQANPSFAEVTPQAASSRTAANDSAWKLRALGSLAVLGLAGLLVLQFDRGRPDERELALGQPSASTAPAPQAPARAETPPLAAPALATAPSPSLPEGPPDPPVAAGKPTPNHPPAAPPGPADEGSDKLPRSASVASKETLPAPSAFPAAPVAPAAPRAAANDTADTPVAPPETLASRSAPVQMEHAPASPSSDALPAESYSGNADQAPARLQAKRARPPAAAAMERSRPATGSKAAQASGALAERRSEVPAPGPDAALLGAAARGSLQGTVDALAQGADINARQPDGRTALMLAAGRGDVAVIRLLIDRGADPQRLDREGLNAADWARRSGHPEVLPLLEVLPAR
jgi:hypothetical protein